MTTLNPDGKTTVAALLALLDAATAIIQLPPAVRRQAIGCKTLQHLLEDAKALDWLLSGDDRTHGIDTMDRIHESYPSYQSHEDPLETPPTAPNGPRSRQSAARPPTHPAPLQTPVLPPIFSATANGDRIDATNGINKSYAAHQSPDSPPPSEADAHPSGRLPFAEFDKLCRAEIKRLSMDGRLPGHKLWNNERNPQLPTMAAILLRYGTTSLTDLAKVFGLEPPLSVAKENKP